MIALVLGGLTRSALIFASIIGAEIFSNFATFAGLPDELCDLVYNLGPRPRTLIGIFERIRLIVGFPAISLWLLRQRNGGGFCPAPYLAQASCGALTCSQAARNA